MSQQNQVPVVNCFQFFKFTDNSQVIDIDSANSLRCELLSVL